MKPADLERVRAEFTPEAFTLLVDEVERLQAFVKSYGDEVTGKLDLLEDCRVKLEAENQRLLVARDVMRIERDAVVALAARLAHANGYKAGITGQSGVAVELPSGQVSWLLDETEAHLLEGLPEFQGAIEPNELEETYRRVMNPGLSGPESSASN